MLIWGSLYPDIYHSIIQSGESRGKGILTGRVDKIPLGLPFSKGETRKGDWIPTFVGMGMEEGRKSFY
jgi:hypothetical protein